MDSHENIRVSEIIDFIITIREYDDNHMFMTIYKNNENMFMRFEFRGFEEEMEYWDFALETGKMNDEAGFIFDKENCEMIEMETKRFILENMMV